MPTYEYVCEKCGHQFDVFQRITEKALTTCPRDKCARKAWGKGKVKRMIGGGAGLLFKGSGFYITDYRSEKYKEAAKKESGAAAPAEAKPGAPAAPATGSGDKPAPSTPSTPPAPTAPKTEAKAKGGKEKS